MSRYVLMIVATHVDGRTTGTEVTRGTKDDCELAADRLPRTAITAPDVASVEVVLGTEEQWEKCTGGVVGRPS